MNKLLKITAAICTILAMCLFVGCEQGPKDKDESIANKNLEKAIVRESNIESESNDRYVYFYQDLNNDNVDEIIAYLWGPDFSGTGGATMMIFSQDKDDYNLISKTTVVNMPIYISEESTNGYSDIIVTVMGGGVETPMNTVLKYENNAYPLNASTQPKVDINSSKYIREINIDINPNEGFKL